MAVALGLQCVPESPWGLHNTACPVPGVRVSKEAAFLADFEVMLMLPVQGPTWRASSLLKNSLAHSDHGIQATEGGGGRESVPLGKFLWLVRAKLGRGTWRTVVCLFPEEAEGCGLGSDLSAAFNASAALWAS